MPVLLKTSGSLEILGDALAGNIRKAETNVFTASYIVTQTEGMNIWLRQKLAAELGIAANIHFISPSTVIFKLYQYLNGPFFTQYTRENIIWMIYGIVGSPSFLKQFPQQAAYFSGEDDSVQNTYKKIGLAETLADLFDQYQLYRPDMIDAWNEKNDIAAGHEKWQYYIWQELKRLTHDKLPDKATVRRYILSVLSPKSNEEVDASVGAIQQLQRQIPALHLFGLSIITDYHLEVLTRLSDYIEIHFYLVNPAPELYWQEDSSSIDVERLLILQKNKTIADYTIGNTLLTNWGKVLQRTLALLYRSNEVIFNYAEVLPAPSPADKRTLLGKIQQDIFYNHLPEEQLSITEEDLTDGSIKISCNYTIVREVEALYQYLVDLANNSFTSLKPRDIVVMVNDINKYAPYIKGIFDNEDYKFPYRIADTALSNEDNLYSGLTALLDITAEEFTSEKVMQLLDYRLIRDRFGLYDISLLREKVKAANIRFGFENEIENDTYTVSWEYGINRLMYGLCMSGEPLYDNGGYSFYPMDNTEGKTGELLTGFVHFVQQLIIHIKDRRKQRNIDEWVSYITACINNLLVLPSDNPSEDYLHIVEQLSEYREVSIIFNEKIPFEVFRKNFKTVLESNTKEGLFITHGITFCSLIPMRSIPFKHIAILGLNHDTFPRKEVAVSFNIMSYTQRLGDRNVKDNDKLLLLETLCAAEKSLYISYIGMDARQNKELPPSILIEELIEYIGKGFVKTASTTSAKEIRMQIKKQLIVYQPLNSYSKRMNNVEGLYKYSVPGEKGDVFRGDKLVTIKENTEALSFTKLKQFYKNSIVYYLKYIIGLDIFNEKDLLLPETELFELDKLGVYQIEDRLLNGSLSIEEETLTMLIRRGMLPLKSIGAYTLNEITGNMTAALQKVNELKGAEKAVTKSFEIATDGGLLYGEVAGIYGEKLVRAYKTNNTEQKATFYVDAVVAISTGLVKEAHLFFMGSAEEEYYAMITPDKVKAGVVLNSLVNFYQREEQHFTPFYRSVHKELMEGKHTTDEGFELFINKRIGGFKPETNEAVLKAWQMKLFQKEGIAKRAHTMTRAVLKPLEHFKVNK